MEYAPILTSIALAIVIAGIFTMLFWAAVQDGRDERAARRAAGHGLDPRVR